MASEDQDRRETILVVDDEPGIRQGCRRVLEPEGFQVETAATLREGLVKLQSREFDLVLVDVMMPDGRGFELLAPIHEQDPDTIAIIITGYATVELAVEAIKAGAYDFIAKPFTPDVLLLTVNKGLERRRLARDARQLAALEAERAQLARDKEEAERLSEFKTAFTFKVAHELRAPVAGAISLIRPLLRGLAGQLNDQQQEILQRIEQRLDILMELVNDLLDLAAAKAVAAGQPLEHLILEPIVEEVVDRLSPEAEAKKITVDLVGNDTNLELLATEQGLRSIFTNLLANAIKYTPEKGCVTVRMGRQSGQPVVSVTDTGIGIPAKDLSRIGEEFFRATNARQSGIIGTGLGLSLVRELMTSYGGSLEVDSVEGQGTTITLRWPAGEPA